MLANFSIYVFFCLNARYTVVSCIGLSIGVGPPSPQHNHTSLTICPFSVHRIPSLSILYGIVRRFVKPDILRVSFEQQISVRAQPRTPRTHSDCVWVVRGVRSDFVVVFLSTDFSPLLTRTFSPVPPPSLAITVDFHLSFAHAVIIIIISITYTLERIGGSGGNTGYVSRNRIGDDGARAIIQSLATPVFSIRVPTTDCRRCRMEPSRRQSNRNNNNLANYRRYSRRESSPGQLRPDDGLAHGRRPGNCDYTTAAVIEFDKTYGPPPPTATPPNPSTRSPFNFGRDASEFAIFTIPGARIDTYLLGRRPSWLEFQSGKHNKTRLAPGSRAYKPFPRRIRFSGTRVHSRPIGIIIIFYLAVVFSIVEIIWARSNLRSDFIICYPAFV